MRLGGGKIYLGKFARPRLIHKLSTFYTLCDDRSILNNHTHLAVGVVGVGGEWVGVMPPCPVPDCLPIADAPKRHSPYLHVPSCVERSRQGSVSTPRESRGKRHYHTQSSSCGSIRDRGRVHHRSCSTGG